jgi:eukaryotic-like serine/threonine-protein kinase
MTERDLFIAALRQPGPAARSAFLDQAAAGDADLRVRVEVMLAEHDRLGSFLEQPAGLPGDTANRPGERPTTTLPPPAEAPGAVIGPYKLLEQIGEGGFGVVFMAEQAQPVRRKVALKVLKPGMDTKQVVARFEAERQALALMDHPNIAKVHDGGSTETGRPYFVMELVRGVPVTEFSDQNHLPVRQRLELFITVCRAVQHAHQKGVIHRDLKPSNVLVTLHDGVPVPKVIDFGIAKAMGQQLTERTLFTNFAQMVGTPLYMSPEQAEMSGLDVDTRTDIYAMGVLLYELLTGATPLDKEQFQTAGYDEIRRIIREQEPARPSARVSTLGQAAATVSANRCSEPRKLSALFRGELDWIVLRALEKDRNRRYETASAFVADVQRYLHDEPVLACPPSTWYRFRKLARRNKKELMTASALAFAVLLSVAGLGASTIVIAREQQTTKEALQAEIQAKEEVKQALAREQRLLYFQYIATAAQQLEAGNLGRAEELLDECPPHLRGWEWHYLKRRRYEEPRDLPHPTAVIRVAYSPDRRYLASGCLDGSVTVWDRRTLQRLPLERGPEAHNAHIYGLAFSPDSRYLAAGGKERRILVWDLDARKLRHCFEGHAQTITQLAFRPDGRHLASASEDGTVRLWDLKTGQEGLTFREHQYAVRGLAFSAEGELISADADGGVKIWDPGSGAVADTFRARTRWVSALAFHPNSQRLALASWDGSVELWDSLSAKETRTLRGHTSQITSLAFSPDGRRLASAGDDTLLKVWDATTGHEAIALDVERVPIGVAFSPDGHELACGCSRPNPVVKLWVGTPLSAGEGNDPALSVIGHVEPVVRVGFSPDCKVLVSASRDGTAKVWNAITGREMFTFRGHSAIVCAVAFSPDGQRVASGSWDGTVLIWNASSGHVVYTLRGQADFVYDVAFSPDGKFLASAHSNGTVVLWDPDAGKELRRLRAHKVETEGLAFSPDSTLLATAGGRDITAKLWTLATGEERTLPGEPRRVHSVAFSPDGHYVAASQGGYVTVCDVANGNPVRSPFHTESSRVFHLAFSRDSRCLATTGWDQIVRLWDARTGRKVAMLRGHAGPVLGVAFSPDGRRLASCGGYRGKGEIKIWDVALWEKNQAESRER